MKLARIVLFATVCAALTGCGQAEQPKDATKPVKVGIFSSARECHEIGQLPDDVCTKAIEEAGKEHDKKTVLHADLETCETAEGVNNCERAGGKQYRPRLQAYAVVLDGAPMAAHSLYASNRSGVAFKAINGSHYLTNDPNLVFSESTLELAANLGGTHQEDATGGLAGAAGNIH